MSLHQIRKRLLCGTVAALSVIALAGCGTGGASRADVDSLNERTAKLEQQLEVQNQQLAGLQSELEKLQAAEPASAQAGADNGGTAVTGNNTSPGKGDNVYITFEQYQQIKVGMSYEEVSGIIGGDGSALSESDDMIVYTYSGNSYTGGNAVFSFVNGKLITKAQAGLE
ncbi:hypothetical protein D3C73_1193640 [compost metagenome]